MYDARPIVFYTGDRGWETPLTLEAVMNIPAELSRFVPRFDMLFLDVKSADVEMLTRTGIRWVGCRGCFKMRIGTRSR